MQRNHSRTILVVLTILAVALALAAGGWAATGTVLYTFQNEADGWAPSGVIWLNGRVYGTTQAGGTYNNGTVFELVHTKSGWVKNTLHDFTGGLDGEGPTEGLVANNAGSLYGVAGQILGGVPGGLIFEISRHSDGELRFEVIYVFTGGYGPSGLTIDNAGTLYGVTGREVGCVANKSCGTVFRLSPSRGGGWKLTTLHDFEGADAAVPGPPLYRDGKGNLYGATEVGGGRGCKPSGGCGMVFEVSPSHGGWKFAVLHRFGGPDGANPSGALAMDASGNLYGTLQMAPGGATDGEVYRLTPDKNGWKETAVHYFTGDPDGAGPTGGLIFDRNGDLYGPTVAGGEFGYGAVFQLHSDGGKWKESVLFSFDGGDGFGPNSPMARGSSKALMGSTIEGGGGTCAAGCGVVYEFVP